MNSIIPVEQVINKIYYIRDNKVMLDRDLANLYGVETKVLKQAVRRNIDRFPDDFMFELTREEMQNWRSQIVTSNGDKMGLRYAPMAFTELGVAMLSSVLNSKMAIDVNIQIMRAFVEIRKVYSSNQILLRKIDDLFKRVDKHDEDIEIIIQTIEKMLTTEPVDTKKIGFE